MVKKVWKQRIEPFRIWGNLYFCGSSPSSCHIIDTGEGLILIDPGLPETFYIVIDSMYRMGYKPEDVKIILHTHGHYDHAGATRMLLDLAPEAKTYIGAEDAVMVVSENDLHCAEALDAVFDGFFQPDFLVKDGDKICLGNTEITCLSTPGHTAGSLSFFWEAVDEELGRKKCAMHGGSGINTMMKSYLEAHGLPLSLREQFVPSLERIRDMPVDIHVGSHVYFNNTVSKGKKILAGERDACVDPDEWAKYCDQMIAGYQRMVDRGD